MQILKQDVAHNSSDYEGWWRIAKFDNYLARHAHGARKMQLLRHAMRAGGKAVALAPNRPEGHFWLGASEGLYADDSSWLTGIRMVGKIRDEMQAVERIDPNYEQCSAQRTLARVDYSAPFFEGGDKDLSVKLLEDCLKHYPHDSLSMLYLADAFYALGRKDQAREEYENILKLCPDPRYAPEEQANKNEARAKLQRRFGIIIMNESAYREGGPDRKTNPPVLESERR